MLADLHVGMASEALNVLATFREKTATTFLDDCHSKGDDNSKFPRCSFRMLELERCFVVVLGQRIFYLRVSRSPIQPLPFQIGTEGEAHDRVSMAPSARRSIMIMVTSSTSPVAHIEIS